MKIKIYTYPDKRPDFIEKQLKSLKHFLKDDDYELIVINNGSTLELKGKIENISIKNNLTHFFVEAPDHSNPTIACSRPINWSLKKFIIKEKNVISVILDSDMFLINHFSFNDYIKNFEIAGVKQKRQHINYIWNGIVIINNDKIKNINEINFDYGTIENVMTDVGGFTYYYFKNNNECKLKNIFHTSHIHPKNKNIKIFKSNILEKYNFDFCFELYENSFLHYGRGSNWDKMPENFHQEKTEFLDFVLDESKKNNVLRENYKFIFNEDEWSNQ